jgi:transcription initiation factor TFIIB
MEDPEDQLWQLLANLRTSDESPESSPTLTFSSEEEVVCDHCGSRHMISEDGQHICLACNSVQSRVIDTGAEWRYYGAEDSRDGDPTRCGMPTNDLLPKSSLGSVIGGRRGENSDMRRIRMYQMWNSMPYWERTLYSVFDQLANNTAIHGIPVKVLNDAKVMYTRASEKKISRGENKEGLIASCIYHACLVNKYPCSPKNVARMFHIDPNILTKGNARFQTLLKLNVDPHNPQDYVAGFGSQLKMDFQDIERCKKLVKHVDDLEIVSENAPNSVAAGTIYFYCITEELDFNKKQIAEVCDVSEVTISKCYKRILKYKEMLVSAY